jgi:short-subunit dehydrogenase
MLLKGKTIFITGGTGGIGAPLIVMLRAAGAVVQAYDRKKDGDLAENIDQICNKLVQDTPDIVINMAGYNDFNHAEDQDYQSILGINLLVPMRICQAVLPAMKKRNSGQIINIGSMTALIPLPHFTGYASAKAGLKAFNDSLRRELGGTNISVTHIIPRAVRTAMNEGSLAEINERTHISYDDPTVVAARIFNAISKREREVRFGWPERLFAFLNANFPFIVDQGLQKNRKIGEEILNQDNSHKEIFDEKNDENTSPVHLTVT